LTKRFSADPKADPKKLNVDYAQAMREVMRQIRRTRTRPCYSPMPR